MTKQQWKWKNFANKEDPDFMQSQKRLLQIYGPPGSGKSSATFHWVQRVCRTCPTKAYWISCAAENEQCWFIEGAAGGGSGIPGVSPYDTPHTAEAMLDTAVVVFDGIWTSTVEKWRGMINDLARKGIAVIVVSSEGVRFHEGDSQDIMKLEHFVPSWTLDEYHAACIEDDLWRSCYEHFEGGTSGDNVNQRQRLIGNKFTLAGHSAQFMFAKFTFQIEQKIRRDAGAMGGIDSLEKALRSIYSSGAINTVLARLQVDKNGTTPQQPAVFPAAEDLEAAGVTKADFHPLQAEIDQENAQPRLVSAFASDEVIKNIPASIERLRNIARCLSNKAIEGYAFEQQLEKSLRESASPGFSLVLLDENRQRIEYQVKRLIKCNANELEETLRDNLEADAWIFVCEQQGAFDAVHVVSQTHIRFVQATVGQKHSFYLDIIDSLLRKLNNLNSWTHMEFMVLRAETERSRGFRLNTPRGGLQQYLRFDEQAWDRRDYQKNVIYKFLEWTEG